MLPETAAGWQALFSGVTAVFAAISVPALLFLFQQLRDAQRRSRAELAPYLRVDLAPQVEGGTWSPPPEDAVGSDLRWEHLNPDEPRPSSELDQWAGDVPIYLWVKNRQNIETGLADDVVIEVELEFPGKADPQTTWVRRYVVVFAYLEAGHLNRYEIGKVDRAIPHLKGRVVGVQYRTMFGRRSTWAHGAAAFDWRGAALVNERWAFRGFKVRESLRRILEAATPWGGI